MEISGRTALVTGGAAGLGRTIAAGFAAAGARVAVADVDRDKGEETVRLIERAGGEATFVEADMTRPEHVERMVATAEAAFSGLDVLVNNAGGAREPTFPDAPLETWSAALDLNLRGPMHAIQVAIPALVRGAAAPSSTSPRSPASAASPTGVPSTRSPRPA